MSGLRKAKKYDWKDSNMALFGSDTEKQVKKEAAETEPAWEGAGSEVGLKIWRIVKFEVTPWPEEDYGSFFDGDSYIILNTYKKEDSDELEYDVHFWIGKHSTQDEYGTAAYKTVELDTFLDDKPIQHREVQGHESALFRSYFSTLRYMKGGAETGFRRVTPEEFIPRLLKFSKEGNNVCVKELARADANVNSGDVFILDFGTEIIQWNGSSCQPNEKFKAAQFIQDLKSERCGRVNRVEQCDEGDGNHAERKFRAALDQDPDDDDNDDDQVTEEGTVLLKVSDEDGSMDMEEVATGTVTMDQLGENDVYIVDTRKIVFVWVGNGASIEERRNGIPYAHKYLQGTSYPYLPITVVGQGQECKEFNTAIAA